MPTVTCDNDYLISIADDAITADDASHDRDARAPPLSGRVFKRLHLEHLHDRWRYAIYNLGRPWAGKNFRRGPRGAR